MKKIFKRSLIATLPVLTGYLVLGFGFGIILKASGYGILLAFVMSFAIYAGSMQYVAIGLITGGASLITTALTTLMVNARHLFYGLSMIEKYKDAGKKKTYLIFSLTDETYSLLCGDAVPGGVDKHWYQFFVSFFNQCYWILGCVLGSLLGTLVPFNTAGIDFSMTALFTTVFVEQWLTAKNHWPAIVGLTASVLCLALFGADSFLLPAMITITMALLLMKKSKKMGGEDRE